MNVIDTHTGLPDAGLQRDEALERQIDEAYEKMIHAPTDAGSRAAFTEMAVLIRRRSPQQIHKMELERRIARKATGAA